MPKSNIESQIQARVSVFVDELTELVRQSALEAVEEVLRRSGAPAGAPPGKKATSRAPATKKRVRRATADIQEVAGAVLAHVKANPGQRLEEMSPALGVDSKDLKRPVRDLLAAGKLRKEGERRGTRYFSGAARAGKKAKPKTSKPKKAAKVAKRTKKATTAKTRTTKKKSTSTKTGTGTAESS